MTGDQERFRSAYQEYSDTYSRQLQTQQHLNSRAIEILKVNLLVGSLAASIITFSPENIAIPYFLTGSVLLVISVVHCAKVYSPRRYDIGIAKSAFQQMKETDSLEDHFERLADEYSGMVDDFEKPFKKEVRWFERGLWLAIGSIIYYFLGAGSTMVETLSPLEYSFYVDIGVILLSGALILVIAMVSEKD